MSDYGRNFYSRHDFEAIETERAEALMDDLRARVDDLPGTTVAGRTVEAADEFDYHDPVTARSRSGRACGSI